MTYKTLHYTTLQQLLGTLTRVLVAHTPGSAASAWPLACVCMLLPAASEGLVHSLLLQFDLDTQISALLYMHMATGTHAAVTVAREEARAANASVYALSHFTGVQNEVSGVM
jgi:hypothetical protein